MKQKPFFQFKSVLHFSVQLQKFSAQRNTTGPVTCGLWVWLCISCKSITVMTHRLCCYSLSTPNYIIYLVIRLFFLLSYTDFVDILHFSLIMVWQYPQEWKEGSVMGSMSSPTQSGAMCLRKVRWGPLFPMCLGLLFWHALPLDISVSPGKTQHTFSFVVSY